MLSLLKNIGRGILRGLKDLLPVFTEEVTSRVIQDAEQLPNRERLGMIIAELITSRGGMIVVFIFLLDQFFGLGLFDAIL